jgi:hypothetical protein
MDGTLRDQGPGAGGGRQGEEAAPTAGVGRGRDVEARQGPLQLGMAGDPVRRGRAGRPGLRSARGAARPAAHLHQPRPTERTGAGITTGSPSPPCREWCRSLVPAPDGTWAAPPDPSPRDRIRPRLWRARRTRSASGAARMAVRAATGDRRRSASDHPAQGCPGAGTRSTSSASKRRRGRRPSSRRAMRSTVSPSRGARSAGWMKNHAATAPRRARTVRSRRSARGTLVPCSGWTRGPVSISAPPSCGEHGGDPVSRSPEERLGGQARGSPRMPSCLRR